MSKILLTYCINCLTPNTRPHGRFNEQGICSACEFSTISNATNYEHRLAELSSLIRKVQKGRTPIRWDCIVGVSGGKDSTRQALWVREKLGMNPLLVCVAYPPRHVAQRGVDNLSNLCSQGFDLMIIGPAPRLSRDLVREAFLRFGNWLKATEMSLFAGVPRIAVEKKIPLIFWGENPALQVGDMATLGASIWDGNNLIKSNTLAGGDLAWFKEVSGGEQFLNMYKFPSSNELAKAKVQTIFLGPAWKDWSNDVNSRFSLTYGFKYRGGDPKDTGDASGTSMVDEDWVIVNYLLKYYKLGFSRATERANELIREGLLSREEGIRFVELYDDGCSDRYIDEFCSYIGLTTNDFWATVRKFANPLLFDISGDTRPVKKFNVGIDSPLT